MSLSKSTVVGIISLSQNSIHSNILGKLTSTIEFNYGTHCVNFSNAGQVAILLLRNSPPASKLCRELLRGSISLPITQKSVLTPHFSARITFDLRDHSATIAITGLGRISVYYSFSNDILIWGTDPGLIAIVSSGGHAKLDVAFVQKIIECGTPLGMKTPFINVFQVQQACSVRFTHRNQIQYKPVPTMFEYNEGCSKTENWVNKCISVTSQAVFECVEGASRVGVLVSGGIDSSLLLKLSEKVLGKNNVIPIHFSYPSSATANEEGFLRDLVDQFRKTIVVDAEANLSIDGQAMPSELPLFAQPHREFLTVGVWKRLRHRLLELDTDTILSGFAGDQIFMAQNESPLHLMPRGYTNSFFDWIKELYRWSARSHTTVWSSLLEILKGMSSEVPILNRYFMERMLLNYVDDPGLLDCWIVPVLESVSPMRRLQAFSILHLTTAAERVLNYEDLQLRYPYAHQDVIAFALRVPLNEHLGQGWDRFLQRRVASIMGVPPSIAWRNSKGNLLEPMIRACRRNLPELQSFLNKSYAVERGILTSEAANQLLTHISVGHAESADKFLNFYACECWLRTRPEFSIAK